MKYQKVIIPLVLSLSYSNFSYAQASSNATYNELENEVGCKSKYSKDKKNDIFNSKYKGHWMTWKGVVFLARSDSASLNLDGKGIQDLDVNFRDKKAGYDLVKGETIRVRFLMERKGGCLFPFSGTDAIILK